VLLSVVAMEIQKCCYYFWFFCTVTDFVRIRL